MFTDSMSTPVGTLFIQASAQGISKVDFVEAEPTKTRPNELTAGCKQQLRAYFEGKRKTFDLPLDQRGTDFQRSVWKKLTEIPFGQAVSYRDIAEMVGNRKAVRAVGAANGSNPIAIIVPCHRVIGADRALTGYAGGLQRKAWLLKHEGIAFKSRHEDEHFADTNNWQSDLFDQ